MILDENSVIELVKKFQAVPNWVQKARMTSDELRALVNGDNFQQFLIENIDKIESKDRALARKKYAKDIRDLFSRALSKRDNVFQANGGSEEIRLKSDKAKEQLISILGNIKGGKSLQEYLSEYYFQQADIDPNGLIFLEYKTIPELSVYPTYKSIKNIRYYECNGQNVEVLIFEPKFDKNTSVQEWRIVDSKTDWNIKIVGNIPVIDKDKTFEHPFGQVPALVLSNIQKVGEKTRISYIDKVVELAKDYARDKSILTIYKFLNGFPIHWRYVTQCRTCTGTGKKGTENCKDCNGKGVLGKGDVTDMINVTKPREGDPILTPNLAGFIQPDLETWRQYQDDLKKMEVRIIDTLWGTETVEHKSNETATGRFIDVQPITTKLNKYTDVVEFVHNQIANWVSFLIDPTAPKDEKVYHKSYGRRFLIEDTDTVLKRYEEAKSNNDNSSILDKLLEEFVLSKYKSDPYMQDLMLKKIKIEPFIHYDVDLVNNIFGVDVAKQKMLFNEFWKTADTSLSVEELSKQFKSYKYE